MAEANPQQTIRPLTAAAVELAATVPEEVETLTQVLLHLNQLSAILAGHAEAGDPRRVLSALYSHLARLAGKGPQVAGKVQVLLDQLNELAAEGGLYAAPVPSQPKRSRRRAGTPHYRVRQGARGERLIEHREGSEKDFYVTQTDYEAAVSALARTARPAVKFEPLHEAFLAAGGSATKSAYPLRVVLRFLRHHQPPLIVGQRASYSLTRKPAPFQKQVRQAWDQLAKV